MNKVIVITGASQGIGAATAKLAATRGYAVCVNCLKNHAAVQSVADEITASGGVAIAVAADVSLEAEVQRLFQIFDEQFGPITALVNNADILEQQMRVDEMDGARLNRIFASNVIPYFLCAKEAVKRMSNRYSGSGGAIVNVSSAASCLGSAGGYVDYAASKGAIDTLTFGLSKEVISEAIRVNAVRPAFIYTDIHADGGEAGRADCLKSTIPMQRGGTALEGAHAIMWLVR
jgi:NAD(P)-dependent dehydrogenase (short-subunit alcohol dehydrogenase family)